MAPRGHDDVCKSHDDDTAGVLEKMVRGVERQALDACHQLLHIYGRPGGQMQISAEHRNAAVALGNGSAHE
jgi:hypothetical protein